MKKAVKIVAIVVLCLWAVLSTCLFLIARDANNEKYEELQRLQSTYKTLTSRCEELYDENQLLKDGLYSETYLLDAAIGLIHPEAKGHKVENVYIAIAPLEAMGDINSTQIAYALKTYDEIESLIITFIGDSPASYTIRIDR